MLWSPSHSILRKRTTFYFKNSSTNSLPLGHRLGTSHSIPPSVKWPSREDESFDQTTNCEITAIALASISPASITANLD